MINGRLLILDNQAEIFKLLEPWADQTFWDFNTVDVVPASIIVVGRQHLLDNMTILKNLATTGDCLIVFSNPAEGAWTLETQIQQLKIEELVRQKRMLLIGGASMDPAYPCVTYEHFLSCILDYEENLRAQAMSDQIFTRTDKPYKFLFLNGRARPHRKYLYERLKRTGALDHALWTMLDARPCVWRSFQFREQGIDVMSTVTPIQHLPKHYEVPRYRDPWIGPMTEVSNIKQDLFNREWGEIYLEPAPYIDTYFSLVTETICAESAHSFRTEKTAKALAMGHPFIVVANAGFYRDLHNLGFRTFGHVIDQTFDRIEHHQERVDRITQIVTDLCQQDLASFLKECYNVCKYNQQHLAQLQVKHRQEFPGRFFQFIKQQHQSND